MTIVKTFLNISFFVFILIHLNGLVIAIQWHHKSFEEFWFNYSSALVDVEYQVIAIIPALFIGAVVAFSVKMLKWSGIK